MGPHLRLGCIAQVAGGYRRPLPDFLPEQLHELISECWAQDMRQRPSMAQVLDRLREIESLGLLDKKGAKKEGTASSKKPKKWLHIFS
jgi:hypothetical protein